MRFLPSKWSILTLFVTTYTIFRGPGETYYDIKTIYKSTPSFPSHKSDHAVTKAEESLLTASSAVFLLKNINTWNYAALIFQEVRSGFDSSSKLIDGISGAVTGYKIASIAANYANPVAKIAKDVLYENFSEETIDFARKTSMITAGAVISYMTLNPVPLYFAIKDSCVASDYPMVMSAASFAVSASFGKSVVVQNAFIQAIDYIAPKNSALRFFLHPIQQNAEFSTLSVSYKSDLPISLKAFLVFNNVAKFCSSTLNELPDAVYPNGSELVTKRMPNIQELTYTPLFNVLILTILFPDVKFGNNPSATTFIRDLVKALPVFWMYLSGVEFGSTGLTYSSGNVATAFSKPGLKMLSIFILNKGFGVSMDYAGRLSNIIIEPGLMVITLASKGMQQQQYKFSQYELQIIDGKMIYMTPGLPLLEIDVPSIYEKLITKTINSSDLVVNFKDANKIWDVVEENGYPSSRPGYIKYISEHASSLALRGLLVGALKASISDQLGTMLEPLRSDADSVIKNFKDNKFIYAVLKFFTEASTTAIMTPPARVACDALDAGIKVGMDHFNSTNSGKKEAIVEDGKLLFEDFKQLVADFMKDIRTLIADFNLITEDSKELLTEFFGNLESNEDASVPEGVSKLESSGEVHNGPDEL